MEWAGNAVKGIVGMKNNKGPAELRFLLFLHQRVSIYFLFLNFTLSLKDRQDENYGACFDS